MLFDYRGGGGLVVVFEILVQVEHARGDVVVVGAGFHFGGFFDGDFRGQATVDDGFGELVALPGPFVEVDRSFGPGVFLRGKLRVEPLRELLRGFRGRELVDDVGIPDAVEIGTVGFGVVFLS